MDKDTLQEILSIHFDSKWGSPYWIAQRKKLSFDPINDVGSISDLKQFPAFPLEVLATHPVTDFLPRQFHDELHRCISSETGGTTGAPKRTVYLEKDFTAAFVTPFVAAAQAIRFPENVNWLYIGPSGPHIIGKAARACAVAMGSVDPFMVDFDPRWVRKLAPGSMGRTRYMEHVLHQAEQVLESQDIGVLFSTPPVLESLAGRLHENVRNSIRGIHLGGMAASPDFWQQLTRVWFPNAVSMAGYGNSLAGVCPQLSATAEGLPLYFPHGERLYLDIDATLDGAYGPVVFHRIEESALLPHVVERDVAQRVYRNADTALSGFHLAGIANPGPPAADEALTGQGLY